MQKLYFFLAVLFLASLLTGCAANVNAQSPEIKAVDSSSTPTDVLENSADFANTEVVHREPPASCPITRAPDVAFIPPEPYLPAPPERYENRFWYGTPELWTMLGRDATWYALPQDKNGYTQKVFWWSQAFDRKADPYPALTVTIEQLDAHASSSPIVVAEEATNASADFGTAMLTGIKVPGPGCWKVTGQYSGAELSFVVWVAP